VVDQPQSSYSHAALAALVRFDAVLVICGNDHLPTGVLLPLADHSQVVWRVAEQVAVSRPLRKQLWKQLVRAKIRAQVLNLPADCPARNKLLELAQKVRSGDPSNVEAHAAKVYWQQWLSGKPFRRDVDGARSECAIELRLRDFCGRLSPERWWRRLAAGHRVVPREPLECLLSGGRPGWSRCVRWSTAVSVSCTGKVIGELNPQTKAGLLGLLADRVRLGDERGPLMVNLHRMVGSLVRCYQGENQPIGDSPGMYLSGYRCMWIVAMFDLPVDTKEARRAYADFVKFLKRDGFTRTQYSVYSRHVPSKENAEVHIGRIKGNLPRTGKYGSSPSPTSSFERMSVFWGKMRRPLEKPPCQLQFFLGSSHIVTSELDSCCVKSPRGVCSSCHQSVVGSRRPSNSLWTTPLTLAPLERPTVPVQPFEVQHRLSHRPMASLVHPQYTVHALHRTAGTDRVSQDAATLRYDSSQFAANLRQYSV